MKFVFILLLVARLCESKPEDRSAMSKILKVNGNDKTLFFGDEKLTKEKMRQLFPDQFGVSRKRRGLSKKGLNIRWPNGEMPYTLSDNFSETEKNSIRNALNIIKSATCIQFTEYALTSAPQDHVALFPGSGCWSYIGRIGGVQQISLQHFGCFTSGIIIHEVLHALGVHHEQARADRDDFVTINFQNILTGRERNFNKRDTDSLGVKYDPKSVMHYGNNAFSNGNGQTITWNDDPTLSLGGDVLTEKDIEQMNLFYDCNVQTTATATTAPATTATSITTTSEITTTTAPTTTTPTTAPTTTTTTTTTTATTTTPTTTTPETTTTTTTPITTTTNTPATTTTETTTTPTPTPTTTTTATPPTTTPTTTTTPPTTTTTTPATTTTETTTTTTPTTPETTTTTTTAPTTTTPTTVCRDRSIFCYLVEIRRTTLCLSLGTICPRSCRLCG